MGQPRNKSAILQDRWQRIALLVGQALYGKPGTKALGHALDLGKDWVVEMLRGTNPKLKISETDLSELAALCRERGQLLMHWAKVLEAESEGQHREVEVPVAREMITEVYFRNDDGSIYSMGDE